MTWYYDELGYPLDQLVEELPRQNPLGASELYFMEPAILMEMQDSLNVRFLVRIYVDPDYPYNYEPVYVSALKNKYPSEYEIASNEENWFSKSGSETAEYLLDPNGGQKWISEVIPEWVKIFRRKGYLPSGER